MLIEVWPYREHLFSSGSFNSSGMSCSRMVC